MMLSVVTGGRDTGVTGLFEEWQGSVGRAVRRDKLGPDTRGMWEQQMTNPDFTMAASRKAEGGGWRSHSRL